MSEKEIGGPAFPHHFMPESVGDCTGMTIRDYFAAKAMQGMLAALPGKFPEQLSVQQVAIDAYKQADAMLEARK